MILQIALFNVKSFSMGFYVSTPPPPPHSPQDTAELQTFQPLEFENREVSLGHTPTYRDLSPPFPAHHWQYSLNTRMKSFSLPVQIQKKSEHSLSKAIVFDDV